MLSIKHIQRRLNEVSNVRPLAKISGLSERTVYRIKNGDTAVTLRTMTRLQAALNAVYPERKAKEAA